MHPRWQIGGRWYWDIEPLVPDGPEWTDYDALMLATYAGLILDDRAGRSWAESYAENFKLDPADDPQKAKTCWQSHFDRAIWMYSEEGMQAMERHRVRRCGNGPMTKHD